jgi:phage shock protein PspC (stress-responsive transcriptional regulator)
MFDMRNFLNKLKSRKFLTCVAGVVMGVCMVFGLDTNAVNTIAGAVTALGSIATYIYSEGKIDAAAVSGIKDAADKVENAVETVITVEE